jgi:SAM-dependent methyltransferase
MEDVCDVSCPCEGIVKMSDKDHWNGIYERKTVDQVSWYTPHLTRSLAFIDRAALAKNAAIIDVGAGASTLVDDLVARGYADVTVLDVSAAAIARAQERLGAGADSVKWLVADITRADLPEHAYDFWHDRAVFHFLRDADARARYVAAVRRSLRPRGHIVVATFGVGGPEQCSGLDVARYDADGLYAEFGDAFEKVASDVEVHRTPWGAEQEFIYCYCRLS